jgi:hypothetical protein
MKLKHTNLQKKSILLTKMVENLKNFENYFKKKSSFHVLMLKNAVEKCFFFVLKNKFSPKIGCSSMKKLAAVQVKMYSS